MINSQGLPKCKGCLNYLFYKSIGNLECKYAPTGHKFLLKCSCGDCLIKSVCKEPCDLLIYDVTTYPLSMCQK